MEEMELAYLVHLVRKYGVDNLINLLNQIQKEEEKDYALNKKYNNSKN